MVTDRKLMLAALLSFLSTQAVHPAPGEYNMERAAELNV
jgi:hypothetical protein